MTAALDTSYRQLPGEVARAYRLLARCPGPDLTIEVSGATLATDPGTATRLISALIDASLLDEPAAGRYRFHGQTREHAQRQEGEDRAARDAALARAIDYYLLTSARADLAIQPARLRHAPVYHRARLRPAWPGGPSAAMAWLEAGHGHLVAAQQAAYHAELFSLAAQFGDTLWGRLLYCHDHTSWLDVCETALDAAIASGDLQAQYMAGIRVATFYRTSGDGGTARRYADDALAAVRKAGNLDAEASTCEHMGLTYAEDGTFATAVTWFERGLELYAIAGGNTRGEAIIHHHLGRTLTILGKDEAIDYLKAGAHLKAALDGFTEINDVYGRAGALTDIAEMHLSQQIPEAAIEVLHQALPLAGQAAAPYQEARVLTVLAEACAQAGDIAQARTHLAEVTALHDQLGLPADHPARQRVTALAAILRAPGDPSPGPAGPGDQASPSGQDQGLA